MRSLSPRPSRYSPAAGPVTAFSLGPAPANAGDATARAAPRTRNARELSFMAFLDLNSDQGMTEGPRGTTRPDGTRPSASETRRPSRASDNTPRRARSAPARKTDAARAGRSADR